MVGIPAAFTELVSKSAEKGKEIKSNVENFASYETKEFLELKKSIAQEADIETARDSSLSSVLEENKEKREVQDSRVNETDESNEGNDGLTDEQKERLREITGWSDEILDSIGSWDEAEIYMKSGLK